MRRAALWGHKRVVLIVVDEASTPTTNLDARLTHL